MSTDVMCIDLNELDFDQVIVFPALIGTDTNSDARFKLVKKNVSWNGTDPTLYTLEAVVRVDDLVLEATVESPETTCGAIIRKLQAMARFHRESKVKVTVNKTLKVKESW